MTRKWTYKTDVSWRVFFAIAIVLALISAKSGPHANTEVLIKGGFSSKHKEEIHSFVMDKHLVTVTEFDEFVIKTGYTTDAERYGGAGVFDIAVGSFVLVEGANYKYPFGKALPKAVGTHPVTQVS